MSSDGNSADGSSCSSSTQPLRHIIITVGAHSLRLNIVHDPEKARVQNEFSYSSRASVSRTVPTIPGYRTSSSYVTNAANRVVPRLFTCEECGKPFMSQTLLDRHMLTHSRAQNYACEHCPKRFTYQQSLNAHMRTHTGVGLHRCDICSKTFARQQGFKMHMALHRSGLRNYCQLCCRWFHAHEDFDAHIKQCETRIQAISSTRERFKCSFCEKTFKQKRDVVTHERTHTNERPYACGYCDRRFAQSQSLTIHIRTHTGEKPYKCEQCNATFADNSALRKHETVNHPLPVPNVQIELQPKSTKQTISSVFVDTAELSNGDVNVT